MRALGLCVSSQFFGKTLTFFISSKAHSIRAMLGQPSQCFGQPLYPHPVVTRGSHSRSSLCNHLTMCFSAQSGQGFTSESQGSFSALLVTLESTDPLSSHTGSFFQFSKLGVQGLFVVAASVPHGQEKIQTNEQWLVTLRISYHETPPFYREALWTRRWSISNWYV